MAPYYPQEKAQIPPNKAKQAPPDLSPAKFQPHLSLLPSPGEYLLIRQNLA